MQGLVQQAEELIPEIGLAAGSAYKTKEGGTGGFIGQLMAAKAGETAAKQKLLGDQIAGLTRSKSESGSKYITPAAVKTAMAGIGGKPDTSIFRAQITQNEDEVGPGFGLPMTIGQYAEWGGLPPELPEFQLFYQTSKVGQTWPQFMRSYKQQWLGEQEPPATEITPEFYKAAIEQWRKVVAS